MKQILFILLSLLTWLQKPVDPLQKVAGLLKDGNTEELTTFFSSTVDLTLLDESHIYSKAQAAVVLDRFFYKNVPKSMKIMNLVNNNSNYKYGVISLQTSMGTYRAAYTLKNIKGVFYITNMTITPEKDK